jgi:hypothetical protein
MAGMTALPRAGLQMERLGLEATTGFEPVNKGFADPRLTTWLRRPETVKAAGAAYSRADKRKFGAGNGI